MQIHFLGSLKHLEDALLGECRGKYYGEIGEGRHTIAYRISKGVDDLLRLLLHKIPLIYNYHKTLIVLLDKLEDIHVLGFYSSGGIKHQDTYITILDGTYGTHDTIELQVLGHLVLSTDTCRIYKIEVKAKLIVSGVNTVTCCTGNLCNDITILTYEGINYTALTRIGATYYGKAGYALLKDFRVIRLQLLKHQIK